MLSTATVEKPLVIMEELPSQLLERAICTWLFLSQLMIISSRDSSLP
jgi:hypothetical protein